VRNEYYRTHKKVSASASEQDSARVPCERKRSLQEESYDPMEQLITRACHC
jgi:hypothetical protein